LNWKQLAVGAAIVALVGGVAWYLYNRFKTAAQVTLNDLASSQYGTFTKAQITSQNAVFAKALASGQINQAQYDEAMVVQNARFAQATS